MQCATRGSPSPPYSEPVSSRRSSRYHPHSLCWPRMDSSGRGSELRRCVTCAAAAGECGRALCGVQGGGRPLRHRDVDLRRLPRHLDGLLLHRRPIPGVSTRLDLAWRHFRLASAQASALRSGGSAGRRRTGDGRAPRFRSGGRHASRTQAWRKRLCNERRICPFYQFFRKLCSFIQSRFRF